jgi:hypothetical protein
MRNLPCEPIRIGMISSSRRPKASAKLVILVMCSP